MLSVHGALLSVVLAELLLVSADGRGYFPEPHVHVTPPCYDRKGGWHDIAGALQHPVTGRWHLFVGPSWQHV